MERYKKQHLNTKQTAMTTNNILTATLDDIIFEGRNKLYGAYELRTSYEKRIGKALLVTGLILGIAIAAAAFAGKRVSNSARVRVGPEVSFVAVDPEKKIEKLPEPEQAQPEKKAEVKTEKFTTFKPVEEPSTPPPSQQTLSTAAIGNEKKDGIEDDNKVKPSEPDKPGTGNGVIDIPVKKEIPDIFTEVAIPARFLGNWPAFLIKNLNGNVPVDNGAQPGRYTVLIQFVVDVDGSVSNIIPLTSLGFGMEEEAIRVLRKAKGWEPAIQNGIKVKAYRKQPVTFEVLDES